MTTTHFSNSTPPVQVRLGAEYEVAGDFAADRDGRLRGVWLTPDGAWAGTVERDQLGTFVSVAMTEEGMMPARENWEYGIVRRLRGVVKGAAPGARAGRIV